MYSNCFTVYKYQLPATSNYLKTFIYNIIHPFNKNNLLYLHFFLKHEGVKAAFRLLSIGQYLLSLVPEDNTGTAHTLITFKPLKFKTTSCLSCFALEYEVPVI